MNGDHGDHIQARALIAANHDRNERLSMLMENNIGIRAVAGTHSPRRKKRNENEVLMHQQDGYTVEIGNHSNGAYFAFKDGEKQHYEHEKTVGRICAMNGFTFILEPEGTASIKINNRSLPLPSLDGTVEKHSVEIYALNGTSLNPQKVVKAISHSRKVGPDRKVLQADVAVAFIPKDSSYTDDFIREGIKEYNRQVSTGEAKSSPLVLLTVDERDNSVKYWEIDRPVKKKRQ